MERKRICHQSWQHGFIPHVCPWHLCGGTCSPTNTWLIRVLLTDSSMHVYILHTRDSDLTCLGCWLAHGVWLQSWLRPVSSLVSKKPLATDRCTLPLDGAVLSVPVTHVAWHRDVILPNTLQLEETLLFVRRFDDKKCLINFKTKSWCSIIY